MLLEKIIPSQDLREYLKNSGYTFSDRETAYFIYHAGDIKWLEKK